jgi:hypothetical protein
VICPSFLSRREKTAPSCAAARGRVQRASIPRLNLRIISWPSETRELTTQGEGRRGRRVRSPSNHEQPPVIQCMKASVAVAGEMTARACDYDGSR